MPFNLTAEIVLAEWPVGVVMILFAIPPAAFAVTAYLLTKPRTPADHGRQTRFKAAVIFLLGVAAVIAYALAMPEKFLGYLFLLVPALLAITVYMLLWRRNERKKTQRPS